MKLERFKYTIVLFLLGIFIAQGISTVAPIFSLTGFTHAQDDLLMNAPEERTSEKETEKSFSGKEFMHAYNADEVLAISTIIADGTIRLNQQNFTAEVFLPISTPPPRLID